MNKRFIFPCNIRLGDIGFIYRRLESEDKFCSRVANIFGLHQGIEQAGML
jgi:hypothetical protein